nr:21 kDa protein-like [Ipomoea batatas]
MKGVWSGQILVLFLVPLVLTSGVRPATAARPVAGTATNTEFIKTSCKATTYPDLCFSSLSIHASAIGADPELLAHTALDVALESAQSTSAEMVKIAGRRGLTPREIGAMQDCVEELGDSVGQIKRSLGEMKQMKGPDFGMKISDIQTWVSAALTDENTCTDGFAGKAMNGEVKTVVGEKIVKVAHMTSNALALVNSFAALHN